MSVSEESDGDPTGTIPRGRDGAEAGPPALKAWKQFQLIERVGAGGFGEVYRAFDTQLHREVALKLLHRLDDESNDAYADTLQEARALARVRHPNVVPIYGVDRHDSRIGFWSEFIQGQTLSALLHTQGPMGEREALQIGMDVCRAVAAVHGAGLLHRDIKASNVIRETGGRILLMDFGLSHEAGHARQMGGTPQYMAPELFLGDEPTVASDLYAVGVLLYHLVTCKFPAEGDRRSLFDERTDLSGAFVKVVEKAIDVDPAKRFGSAGQMLGALTAAAGGRTSRNKWWAIGAAVVVGAAVLAMPAVRHRIAGGGGGVIPQEHYLAAQNLLARYDRPENIGKAIGEYRKELAADPGNALAYAGLARAYWQEYRATRDTQFLKLAEDNCNRAIQIDQQLAPAHVVMGKIQTNAGNTALATQELERAQQLDRRNADVWSATGELYEAEGRKSEAEWAIRKAIDLSPEDWRYHNQLGVFEWNAGQYAEAIAEYRQVVKLTPDNPQGWNNLGNAWLQQGNLAEAKEALTTSLGIAPRYNAYSNLGVVLFSLGKFGESAAMFNKALQMNGSNHLVWGNLGAAYQWSKAPSEKVVEAYSHAASLAEKARAAAPKDTSLLASLGGYKIYLGEREAGLRLIRQAVALDPENPSILSIAAKASESAGLRDEALRLLGAALSRGLSRASLEASPELAQLRQDPRYKTLIDGVKER